MFYPIFVGYWFGAFATYVIMDMTEQIKHDHFAAHVAVWVLWPLFAIKYLAIGASRVLQYGYLLLTGK